MSSTKSLSSDANGSGGFDVEKLSYHDMAVDLSGAVMSKEAKMNLRLKYGYCTTCPDIPIKLFEIKRTRLNPLWSSKTALTVPQECANGICLKCSQHGGPKDHGTNSNASTRRQPPTPQQSYSSASTSSSSLLLPRHSHRSVVSVVSVESRNTTASSNTYQNNGSSHPSHHNSNHNHQNGLFFDHMSMDGSESSLSFTGGGAAHSMTRNNGGGVGAGGNRYSGDLRSVHSASSFESAVCRSPTKQQQQQQQHQQTTYACDSSLSSPGKKQSPQRKLSASATRRGGTRAIRTPPLRTHSEHKDSNQSTESLGGIGDHGTDVNSETMQLRTVSPDSMTPFSPSNPNHIPTARVTAVTPNTTGGNGQGNSQSQSQSHTSKNSNTNTAPVGPPPLQAGPPSFRSRRSLIVRQASTRSAISNLSDGGPSLYNGDVGGNAADFHHTANGNGMLRQASIQSFDLWDDNNNNNMMMNSERNDTEGYCCFEGEEEDSSSMSTGFQVSFNGIVIPPAMMTATTEEEIDDDGDDDDDDDDNVHNGDEEEEQEKIQGNGNFRGKQEKQGPHDDQQDFFYFDNAACQAPTEFHTTDHSVSSSPPSSPNRKSNDLMAEDIVPNRGPSSHPHPHPNDWNSQKNRKVLDELRALVQELVVEESYSVLADVLANSMKTHSTEEDIVCFCLSSYVQHFSEEYPRDAVLILFQVQCHKVLAQVLKGHESSPAVQQAGCEVFALLVRVGGGDDNMKENDSNNVSPVTLITQAGLLPCLHKAMTNHFDQVAIATSCVAAARGLSVNFEARRWFRNMSFSRAIVQIMKYHALVKEIQRDGCAVLSNLAVDLERKQVSTVDRDILECIVAAVRNHRHNARDSSSSVVSSALFSLKNLTYDDTNLGVLSRIPQVSMVLDEIQGTCSEASVVLERVQVKQTEELSLEEQALESLRAHIELKTANLPPGDDPSPVVRDILDVSDQYPWSHKIVLACLQHVAGILDFTATATSSASFSHDSNSGNEGMVVVDHQVISSRVQQHLATFGTTDSEIATAAQDILSLLFMSSSCSMGVVDANNDL